MTRKLAALMLALLPSLAFAQAAAGDAAAGASMAFLVIAACVGLAALALWLWALVDCLRDDTAVGNEKLLWALIILLGGAIGAILYLLIRRPQRNRR